jgi:hypothetical protein
MPDQAAQIGALRPLERLGRPLRAALPPMRAANRLLCRRVVISHLVSSLSAH